MFRYACVALMLIITAPKVSSAGCPDGWTSHHGSCYLYMRETYDWFNALSVCQRLGGHLVEDDSADAHRLISGMLETHGGGTTRIWIGLQDFEEEGSFMWTESKQPVATTYWLKGEPNDDKGEGDCVVMERAGWMDYNCEDGRYAFICQLSAS